jgi:membrane protein DedA with SNARE-associated domain
MLPFFEHYSYFGLFFIILIEEAGVPLPVPGDIFIAAIAALPNANYLIITSTTVIATLIGSTILFAVSRKFGHSLILKFGKYIRLTPEKVKRAEKWFEKYGGSAIVIGRLIPGLRIITPIVAGTFEVSYKTFWLYTTIAAFIWANIYFVIGKFFANLLAAFLR